MSKRKEALTAFNKNYILEIAEQLFNTKGINSTTVDDIARESDFSKSTIYIYFKSKDDIYNHIVYNNLQKAKDSIRSSVEDYNMARLSYYGICNSIVALAAKNLKYLSSLTGNTTPDEKQLEGSPVLGDVNKTIADIYSLVADFIVKGMNQFYLRDDINVMECTLTLIGSICGIVTMASTNANFITNVLDVDIKTFLNNSFHTLWRTIESPQNIVPAN